ncbi:E3 ubiquitin-protein ligase ORTHRUS 5 [Mycena venus]|uniref:E3 ubiquitin-protein ligase ORTHRUS 5 n=1 Tax=Mycena venus TaxID=2733690 RepID=A0A8H6XW29_9AGAR|nr:E3 ubiquitin-protein ligase ORTHRUS 5 [Mycena venus]
MVSDYERQRLENIERNKALLNSLGLDKPFFEPEEIKRTKPKANATSKKRKPVEEHDGAPSPKASRVESVKSTDSGEAGPVRRSSRNAGKTVDYKGERHASSPLPISFKSGIRDTDNSGPLGREAGSKRIHDPKTYGSIPGVEVGTWWETREGCSADAIHAPWVGGIAVGKKGAYSVALSGGYADDVDWGYALCYLYGIWSVAETSRGTKASPLNLRTAPQSSDQTFENTFNRALKPEILRAPPTPKNPFASLEDTSSIRRTLLTKVIGMTDFTKSKRQAWQEKGMEGFLVCKFAFKRLPNQAPLPRRAAADSSKDKDDEVTKDVGAPEDKGADMDTQEEMETLDED